MNGLHFLSNPKRNSSGLERKKHQVIELFENRSKAVKRSRIYKEGRGQRLFLKSSLGHNPAVEH